MKTINISTLKAKASAALREVRDGKRLIILDRDIPVAEIIPYQKKSTLVVTPPKRRFSIPECSFDIKVDPVIHLIEDRHKR